MDLLASVANKRLTAWLSPLDATLTKNRGEGGTLPPRPPAKAAPSGTLRRITATASLLHELLDLQNLLFFGGREVLNLLGLRMRDLFHLLDRALVFVLADLLVFLQLVDGFLDVAADVAHRRAVILQNFVQVLHNLLAALFRRRR